MAIAGILGVLVVLALFKLIIYLIKSIGKDITPVSRKKTIIDDMNDKPSKRKKH